MQGAGQLHHFTPSQPRGAARIIERSGPWNGHLHSYVKGTGYGGSSYASDSELDAMVEEPNLILDPIAREVILKKIARKKQETVLGGIPTYRPKITFAWRTDKVNYTPWPWPGFWHQLQQIGVKE